HYGLKNKYLINGTYRWGASTAVSAQHRWKGFPALGVGYHLAVEEFIKKLGIADMVKLRYSWGKTAKSPSGNYTYLGVFEPITPGYVDMAAIRTVSMQLDNLKWETVTQTDFGVNLAFFKNRLTITGELYNRVTTDLLQKDVKLPSSTGFAEMSF